MTTRRNYLVAAGTATTAAVSGCQSLLSGSSGSADCADDQRETPTAALGPESAPSVEIYEDYTCPGCGQYNQQSIPRLKEAARNGEIQLIHRDFPLPHSDLSRPAAYLGRAVLDQVGVDQFWTYSKSIFANQNSLSQESDLTTYATDAGLASDTAESELESTRYCSVVENSKSKGRERGVDATPTLYYDGSTHDPKTASQVLREIR